ncbi:MAG: hypothetical protein ABI813_04120, partial [Bacteroidota bacterium]
NRKPDPLAVKGFISNGRLHITGTFAWSETCQADLYTLAGQAGDHFKFTVAPGYNSFDFMLKKGPGTGYIVHLWGDRGYSHSFMVLVR